eukprot:gene15867-8738_t
MPARTPLLPSALIPLCCSPPGGAAASARCAPPLLPLHADGGGGVSHPNPRHAPVYAVGTPLTVRSPTTGAMRECVVAAVAAAKEGWAKVRCPARVSAERRS